jgi:hypothetical protein
MFAWMPSFFLGNSSYNLLSFVHMITSQPWVGAPWVVDFFKDFRVTTLKSEEDIQWCMVTQQIMELDRFVFKSRYWQFLDIWPWTRHLTTLSLLHSVFDGE